MIYNKGPALWQFGAAAPSSVRETVLTVTYLTTVNVKCTMEVHSERGSGV